MKIGCIIEARMSSSRLPGKVLMDLMGKPALIRQIERIRNSRYIDSIIVATTEETRDQELVNLLEREKISFFRGSENDVLARVTGTAQFFDLDVIVEITGDCPLVDIRESDKVIETYLNGNYDLAANDILPSYPLGMGTLVMSRRVLEESDALATEHGYREHMCLYAYEHLTRYYYTNIEAPKFLWFPELRLTLDTRQDYDLISRIYQELYPHNPYFNLYDIIKLLNRKPELIMINNKDKHRKR